MPSFYESQLRHSEHYLELLRTLGELFSQGKEALTSAIAEYQSASENVEVGFAWAEVHSREDTQAAHLCIAYSNVASYLLDFLQQPSERLRWLDAALAATSGLNDYNSRAKLLVSKGISYLRLAEFRTATEIFEEALTISKDVGAADVESESLAHLGGAFISLGKIERALTVLEQSLSISRELGNLRTQCIALNSQGQAYYILREFLRAIDCYEASLHIGEKEGFLPEVSNALVNLGKTYAFSNRPRKAIEIYEKSLIIARAIGDKRSEGRVLASLGQASYLLGDCEAAITILQQALIFAHKLGDQIAQVEIFGSLGDSYLEEDQDDLALGCYKQRVAITRSLGLSRFLASEHALTSERMIRPESDDRASGKTEGQTAEVSFPLHNDREKTKGSDANHKSSLIEGESPVREVFSTRNLSARIQVIEDFARKATTAPDGPRTVTWIHLSDFHFQQSSTYDENVVLEPLLEDIATLRKTEGLCPDFAAITGDIAFSGKPHEYSIAWEFFEQLSKVTGLSQDKLFVVPGNHDVDSLLVEPWTKHIGKSITDREVYGQLIESSPYWKLVLRRLEGWSAFFNEHFDDGLTFDDQNYYYAKTFNVHGTQVGILGLNSVWLSHPADDRMHRLVVGERQVRDALKTAKKDEAQIKIALVHHPYHWLREFDQYYSGEYLLDKCNFLLHGHLHRAGLARLSTPDNNATVIAGGACYATRGYPNSYNFVKLDLESNTGVIYFRSYTDNRGGFWAPDTQLYKNVKNGRYEFRLPDMGITT